MTGSIFIFNLCHMLITFRWLEISCYKMLVNRYITVIVIYMGCHVYEILWFSFVCCVVKLLRLHGLGEIWTLAWDPILQQAQNST